MPLSMSLTPSPLRTEVRALPEVAVPVLPEITDELWEHFFHRKTPTTITRIMIRIVLKLNFDFPEELEELEELEEEDDEDPPPPEAALKRPERRLPPTLWELEELECEELEECEEPEEPEEPLFKSPPIRFPARLLPEFELEEEDPEEPPRRLPMTLPAALEELEDEELEEPPVRRSVRIPFS